LPFIGDSTILSSVFLILKLIFVLFRLNSHVIINRAVIKIIVIISEKKLYEIIINKIISIKKYLGKKV